jgi:hypothetical protein
MFVHIFLKIVLFFNCISVKGFSIGFLLLSSFDALSKYVWDSGLPTTLLI